MSKVLSNPKFVNFLFENIQSAPIWLLVRLFLGYTWITSGWGKLTNPKWIDTGEALQAFWMNSLKMEPRPVITYDWYRSFIQSLVDAQAWTWFGKVIAISELAVGLGLILGLFTGIAAIGGIMLNFNFMLAGSASTNPVMLVLEILLVIAWKVAGHWGLDRFILYRK